MKSKSTIFKLVTWTELRKDIKDTSKYSLREIISPLIVEVTRDGYIVHNANTI